MIKKLITTLILIGVLVAGSALTASARALYDDEVVTGGEYTLAEGETIEGNLVVLGGVVRLEEGSVVEGSVVVIGGNTELGGKIEADAVIFGGNVRLLETVEVDGDLVRSGGSVDAEEGYEVKGNETQGMPSNLLDEPSLPAIPGNVSVETGPEPILRSILNLIWGVFSAFAIAIFAGLLAMLVVVLMPEPTARVTAALTNAPVWSAGVGLLTLIAVPVLAALVALVTLLCFSPLSLIALLIYAVGILFGWLALGALIGERLVAALGLRNVSVVLAAGLGNFLLTLLVNLFEVVPGVGGLFSGLAVFLIVSLSLGAVVLTRFGLRPYLSNVLSAQPAPPSSASS